MLSIPSRFIPDGTVTIGEIEDPGPYYSEPADGRCPVCGRPYTSVTWARNVKRFSTGPILAPGEQDYIHGFNHVEPDSEGYRPPEATCRATKPEETA